MNGSDSAITEVVMGGTFNKAARLLAEKNGVDVEIHTEPQKNGETISDIIGRERQRIDEISQQYIEKVLTDLRGYHDAYVEKIKDPVNGSAISDELVDELEQLVNVTEESLDHITGSSKQDQKFQEAT